MPRCGQEFAHGKGLAFAGASEDERDFEEHRGGQSCCADFAACAGPGYQKSQRKPGIRVLAGSVCVCNIARVASLIWVIES